MKKSNRKPLSFYGVVGVASSKTRASTIPGAWLVQFTNASHLLLDEAPIELAKVITVFLDIKQSVNTT